jgi:DNA helicase HerA-like ATPase
MFLGIRSGSAVLIGMITEVTLETSAAAREQGARATASVDLMGEIRTREGAAPAFRRGVTSYPAIGDTAVFLSGRELSLIYSANQGSIDIGHHQQDVAISAAVNLDDMLSKHFAVLGTTGVGKSSGVALILQQILEKRPALRIFLLDGHNEYARCFGERAHILNPGNVKLPFWLFNFEETVDILYGGRAGVDEEIEILTEVIPLAKGNYTQYRGGGGGGGELRTLKKTDSRSTGFTVDTPVPYRLADLVALIDERMGKLENRTSRMKFHRLMQRIEAVSNDPRYGFMFENANVGGDTMADVIAELFRLPPNGKPMTIMQLAGFPTEVVNAVVSVLCRMAFEFGLWSDGVVPLLFVCEEAHRYASSDPKVGFEPTRRALARIAKEGRKYGVFLSLVTQRPAELDATIISQCSTLFALRMANERDQALLRSAISDAGSSLLDFLPSLGTGEALAFGEGVPLPTRFRFKTLPQNLIPSSESVKNARIDASRSDDPDFLAQVIERWRSATMSHKETPLGGSDPVSRIDPATLHAPLAPSLNGGTLRRRVSDFQPSNAPVAPQFGAPQKPTWPPR